MVVSNFSGNWGSHLKLEVNWNRVSHPEQNITHLHYWVDLVTDSVGSIYGQGLKTLTVSGSSNFTHQFSPNIGKSSRNRLLEQEVDIQHDDSGNSNWKINIRADINVGNYGSATVSCTPAFQPYPRGSTVNDVTASIGDKVTLSISKKIANAKHKLSYDVAGLHGVIANDVDTSCEWIIPDSFLQSIPNQEANGILNVETLVDGRSIQTKQAKLTVKVPDKYAPIIYDVEIIDKNADVFKVLNAYNYFIAKLSKVSVGKATTNISAGASLKETSFISVSPHGNRLFVDANRYITPNISGKFQIEMQVIDSRGYKSRVISKPYTVLEYAPPAVSIQAQRTKQDKNKIQITRNVKISPLTVGGEQKNKLEITVRTRAKGASQWNVDDGPGTDTLTTISELINSSVNLKGDFAANKTWEIEVTVRDAFVSTTVKTEVAPESFVYSYDKDSRFAIGKPTDNTKPVSTLDVAGDIYSGGHLIQNYPLTNSQGYSFLVEDPKYFATATGFAHSNLYSAMNIFNDKNSGHQIIFGKGNNKMYARNYTGSWGPWYEVLTTNNLSSSVNNWVSCGLNGFNAYYKRIGDIITVRFNGTATGGDQEIFDIKSPVPDDYMFTIAEWSIDGNANKHLQISKSYSKASILDGKKGAKYSGTVTFAI